MGRHPKTFTKAVTRPHSFDHLVGAQQEGLIGAF
jgi:hypothetical protein